MAKDTILFIDGKVAFDAAGKVRFVDKANPAGCVCCGACPGIVTDEFTRSDDGTGHPYLECPAGSLITLPTSVEAPDKLSLTFAGITIPSGCTSFPCQAADADDCRGLTRNTENLDNLGGTVNGTLLTRSRTSILGAEQSWEEEVPFGTLSYHRYLSADLDCVTKGCPLPRDDTPLGTKVFYSIKPGCGGAGGDPDTGYLQIYGFLGMGSGQAWAHFAACGPYCWNRITTFNNLFTTTGYRLTNWKGFADPGAGCTGRACVFVVGTGGSVTVAPV